MSPHVKPTKIPQERDFTAGMLQCNSQALTVSTGERELDERLKALASELSGSRCSEHLAEMFISAVRTARGSVSESSFRTMSRVVEEMRSADEVFVPYRGYRKVSIYGSARTSPDDAEYIATVDFARKMRDAGFMIITGAGPGIMAAGNEGAGAENSFGLNINLPFEAVPNPFIAGDPKLIGFDYFFTRKFSFIKEGDAVVAFPGGFGTMDEIFETLTLIQTGKVAIYPLVLIDAKGGTYWKFWQQFIEEHLARLNLISDSDFSLYKVTDDVDEAVEEITRFYSNFHSYRYVGDQLIIRLKNKPSKELLQVLKKDYKDILKSGTFEVSGPLPVEEDEPELNSLHRLVFRHGRRSFGRLREFINELNR